MGSLMDEIIRLREIRIRQPWKLARDPFRIKEHVWFVGNDWVSAFLIDTPDGLIMLDCAYQEVFYQTIDSIHRLGFDPRDVKHLLLSHGHYDHCGAARMLHEISGCEIWLGEPDAYFFTERRDLIYLEDHVPEFPIHHYYDYSKPFEFGGIKIRPVPCPGHTPGTTCFFFEMTENGHTIRFGMHGGLGLNGLSREELKREGWPLSRQQEYLDALEKMKNFPVDIVLPSHASHAVGYPFFKIAEQDDGTGDGFICPEAWRNMLESKEQDMRKLIESEK